MRDFLYLGSQSASRQRLLKEIDIPFIVLPHRSNENIERAGRSFDEYVTAIAQHKMAELLLPEPSHVEQSTIFVLTADTLVIEPISQTILGKPKDRTDAHRMMKLLEKNEIQVTTGCCLRKLHKTHSNWVINQEKLWASSATLMFCVAQDEIDFFIEKEPISLVAAGATIIDGFGQRYLKYLNGSHSAVIGLPLYELTQALKELNFIF